MFLAHIYYLLISSSFTLSIRGGGKILTFQHIHSAIITLSSPEGAKLHYQLPLLLVFCDICSSSLSLSFESLDSIIISKFHYYFQDGRPTRYYNRRTDR